MNSDLNPILSELRNYIREQHHIPADDPDFTDDVHLYDYGFIDSFGAAALATFVESKFSIKMNQADSSRAALNTVREIAQFIAKRQKSEI